MAVYVDALRDWGWRLGPSCHLIADTNEELHEFARRLGLKRSWFQAKASGPHYDLTAGKRSLAVRLGAIELDDQAFFAIVRAWRKAAVEAINAVEGEEAKQKVRDHLFR